MRAITIDADTGKRIYTRKEVADLVGASTQSIRLWEDAGAIPASVRDEGGYRYWYEEDLEAIKAYASWIFQRLETLHLLESVRVSHRSQLFNL